MPRKYGVTNLAPYAAAPAVGLAGDVYYNSASKISYVSDGTSWLPLVGGGSGNLPSGGSVNQVLVKNSVTDYDAKWVTAQGRSAIGTTITGAVTAVPGTTYVINLAASLGNVAITMPAAPPQGSTIGFLRLDSNVFTSFSLITAGAGDTVGDTSPYNLVTRNVLVTFTYLGTTWYPAPTVTGASGMGGATPSNAFAPTLMSRDSAGRSQVTDPVAAQDIASKNYVDTSFVAVALVSTATTALPNIWYRGDASAGAFVVTLPIAPVNGTVVRVENVGTANLVQYGRGGATDTIEGSTAVFPLSIGEWSELTYRSANTQWYLRRNLWNPTAGTTVRRDANARAQVADPSAAQDIATKNYVDTKAVLVAPFTMAGTVTVKTGTSRYYVESARTISRVRTAVGTAPTGATLIVDVKKNGTTIFTTQANRPAIAISGFTATVTNMDITAVAAGDYLTVDVAQIGSTVAGADLTVQISMV